jgi:predicted lactoylglutathione lyase
LSFPAAFPNRFPPRQVETAGGTRTAPAHMRPFGVYSGYFTDPDGHLFEIAWNTNEENPSGAADI